PGDPAPTARFASGTAEQAGPQAGGALATPEAVGGGPPAGHDLPPVDQGLGDGGGGRPPRPKLRFRWLRLLGLLVPIAALAIVSTVFGMMMAVAGDLPDLDTAKEFRSARNSILLDRSGKQIGVLAGSNARYVVTADQIAPTMKDAVIAMEDQRFLENSGVDIRGIARAAVQDVISGGAVQGASTITQQLVKMALEAENKRTVFQKLREAALAYHMTRKWTKSKILTMYLNRVYFGNGAYGVESAARTYFGKSLDHVGCGRTPNRPCAKELRPAEAALLTAIIASPSRFDPNVDPGAALRRRNTVLLKMLQQRMLDRAEYETAHNEPLPPKDQIEPPSLDSKNPYFASWVSAQLVERYGVQKTYEGGLKVTTTLDQPLQQAAQTAINTYLSSPDGPQASLVAIDNPTGEVRAMVGGRNYRAAPFNLATQGKRQPGSAFKPFTLAQALRAGISPDSTWTSGKKVFRVRDSAGNRELFRVTNDHNAYSGTTTLARALTFSDNTVYSEVGLKVGTKKIAKLIRQMGIRTPVSSNAALTLGAPKRNVTVLDMAHAYETFATRGVRVNGSLGAPHGGPVGITEVVNGNKVVRNHPRKIRVLSPQVADTTTAIMQSVVTIGTGKRAAYGGFAAGKTGTTSNNVDAWFVGFSKRLTVAVWVGYPNSGKPMQTEYNGEPVEGGTYPAAIWGTFVGAAESILTARAPKNQREPSGSDVPVGDGTQVQGSDGGSGTGTDATGSGTSTTDGTGTTATDGGGGGGGTGGGGASTTPQTTPPANTPPAGGANGTGSGSGSGSGSGGGGGGGGGGAGGGGTGGAVPLG
ncbi:transglycosylase domain-containing protein, partial [Patulibacter medicamentivorans]|uniref:transglycosylase domain-containing protein n=1 Tax=Patulibacter medicamentivorans TaxID=1097667 RepID=UPI000681E0AB